MAGTEQLLMIRTTTVPWTNRPLRKGHDVKNDMKPVWTKFNSESKLKVRFPGSAHQVTRTCTSLKAAVLIDWPQTRRRSNINERIRRITARYSMKMRRSRLCSERVASAWRWARTCRIAPTVCHCDRQAWGEFGDQRKSLLWCFQLLGHRRACVGAVQNIFMRNTLWLGRVGTGATARAWVRRVSRNLRPSCAFGRRWTWRGGLRRAETPRRARCHLKAQKWQHYVYLWLS